MQAGLSAHPSPQFIRTRRSLTVWVNLWPIISPVVYELYTIKSVQLDSHLQALANDYYL